MLSYRLSENTITELRKLSQHAATLAEKIKVTSAAELDYVHRNVRVSMIGASTRIENAVLTDSEIDWLDTVLVKDSRTTAFEDKREFIKDKLSKDKERSIDEVAGNRAMLHLIYSQGTDFSPLTESILCGLHSELLQYYAPAENYKGRYKSSPNRVVRRDRATGEESVVLEPSPPGPLTDSTMRELVKWYNDTLPTHPWTIAVAIEFVFRFLAIHPFQDGNGRLARGLFLLTLLNSPDESLSLVAPFLPFDRHIERERESYYIVLRRVSGGKFSPEPGAYEYEHFLRFMMKVYSQSLADFDFYQKRYQTLQVLPPSALEALQAFKEKPESRLQRKDIMTLTDLPRATATLALQTLHQEGFIQKQGKGSAVKYQLVF